MAGIGTFIMLGIVIGSICVSMYLFLDGQIVTITGEPGNSIIVGNVEFNIIHIGNYEILEKTEEYREEEQKTEIVKRLATSEMAEGVYFQIQILTPLTHPFDPLLILYNFCPKNAPKFCGLFVYIFGSCFGLFLVYIFVYISVYNSYWCFEKEKGRHEKYLPFGKQRNEGVFVECEILYYFIKYYYLPLDLRF